MIVGKILMQFQVTFVIDLKIPAHDDEKKHVLLPKIFI